MTQTKTPSYGEQMREAAQIDETGKSPEWIARFGRDAMLQKTEEWFARAAAYKAPAGPVAEDPDVCSCGKVGCDCEGEYQGD